MGSTLTLAGITDKIQANRLRMVCGRFVRGTRILSAGRWRKMSADEIQLFSAANCGIGAGGFEPGNSCAAGSAAAAGAAALKPSNRDQKPLQKGNMLLSKNMRQGEKPWRITLFENGRPLKDHLQFEDYDQAREYLDAQGDAPVEADTSKFAGELDALATFDAEFESLHPRADDGKFGEGEGEAPAPDKPLEDEPSESSNDVQVLIQKRKRLQLMLDAMPSYGGMAGGAVARAQADRARPLRQAIADLDKQIGERPKFWKPRPATAADRIIAKKFAKTRSMAMFSAEPPMVVWHGKLLRGNDIFDGGAWRCFRLDELDVFAAELEHDEHGFPSLPVDYMGLKINVENPVGSVRSGTDKHGKAWSVTMQNAYGFLKRGTGEDGEGLDVFLGRDRSAKDVYVVHQNKPDTGVYDEDKVMLGFPSPEAARAAYLANYDSPKFFRSMTIIPLREFKSMLTNGKAGGAHWKKKLKREHETAAMFAADGKDAGWITIGGAPGEKGEHEGGTPVKVGAGGKIEAGPAALEGRTLDNLRDRPSRDEAKPHVERAQRIEGGAETAPPTPDEKRVADGKAETLEQAPDSRGGWRREATSPLDRGDQAQHEMSLEEYRDNARKMVGEWEAIVAKSDTPRNRTSLDGWKWIANAPVDQLERSHRKNIQGKLGTLLPDAPLSAMFPPSTIEAYPDIFKDRLAKEAAAKDKIGPGGVPVRQVAESPSDRIEQQVQQDLARREMTGQNAQRPSAAGAEPADARANIDRLKSQMAGNTEAKSARIKELRAGGMSMERAVAQAAKELGSGQLKLKAAEPAPAAKPPSWAETVKAREEAEHAGESPLGTSAEARAAQALAQEPTDEENAKATGGKEAPPAAIGSGGAAAPAPATAGGEGGGDDNGDDQGVATPQRAADSPAVAKLKKKESDLTTVSPAKNEPGEKIPPKPERMNPQKRHMEANKLATDKVAAMMRDGEPRMKIDPEISVNVGGKEIKVATGPILSEMGAHRGDDGLHKNPYNQRAVAGQSATTPANIPKSETSNATGQQRNAVSGSGAMRADASPDQGGRSAPRSPAQRLEHFKSAAIQGRETNVRLPGGQKLKARYAVADADEITPSHDARNQYQKNEFGDINERPYHDPHEGRESRATVERIAADTDFELLHTDTPTAIDGPPIVSDEGIVYGGNARTMGQQLAYHRAGESAAALRKSTLDAFGKFGIDPKTAEGIKNPVIVRVVEGQHERGKLSRVLNDALSAGKSSATEAVSRANKISDSTADRIGDMLSADDAPSIREVLGNPDSAATIMKGFMKDGAWTDADLTKYTDPKSGALNDEGKAVIERSLVGRLIDDASVLANATPQSKNRVMAALPELLRATQKEPKFKKWLFDAVASYGDFKASGLPLEDFYFRQQTMTPSPGFGNRQVATIADAMDKLGPKKFRDAAKGLLDSLGAGDPNQTRLGFAVGAKSETPEDAVMENFGKAKPAQSAMFSAGAETPISRLKKQMRESPLGRLRNRVAFNSFQDEFSGAFVESQHPRGQPANRGQFVEKGASASSSPGPGTAHEQKLASETQAERRERIQSGFAAKAALREQRKAEAQQPAEPTEQIQESPEQGRQRPASVAHIGAITAPGPLQHPHKDAGAVFQQAAETKPAYDALVDNGNISKSIGARDHTDYFAALDDMREGRPGPIVLMADLKGMKRSQEKVESKFAGNYGMLTDVVRGTIAVDNVTDIVGAVEAIQDHVRDQGWKIVELDNKFVKPTAGGYRDLNLKLQAPNGHITELQVNTKAMMLAKEDGHKLYERARSIDAQAAMEKRKLTEDETREIDGLNDQMQRLYSDAWAKSQAA